MVVTGFSWEVEIFYIIAGALVAIVVLREYVPVAIVVFLFMALYYPGLVAWG